VTSTIPTKYLVPEQSYIWKREGAADVPVVEIVTPNDETYMIPAVWNFIVFGVGGVVLTVLFVDALEFYGSLLEGLLTADNNTTEHLKKLLPTFKQELKETNARYAILMGGGTQGLENARALSYHQDEDEAILEFKRVAEAVERGDISVFVDRVTAEPLLRLEEGIKLLVSDTSTAGSEQISPN